MQAEPGIPRRRSLFPGRSSQPSPPPRGRAVAALVVLAAVLGIATPEDARAQTVTVPGPPQNFAVFPSGAHAVLFWSAPENTGGASITTYEYRYAAGDTVPSTTSWTITADEGALSAIVRGLTTGTQYAFEVRAWNSAGAGSAATATATARPLADERPQITLTWDEDAGLEPSFTVTVTFSEAVAGFALQDILVLGFSRPDGRGPSQWEVQAADLQGSGTTYSVEVTPIPHPVQNLPAGSVLFSISSDAVRTVSEGTPNRQRTEIISLIPSVPSVTGTEREALATLYTATGGANWTSKDNWLDDDTDLGEWHGVTTNTDGEVTQLDLRSNKLRGSLPVELGNLRNLTQLYLQGNKLSGFIPPALGLSSLLDLKLHSNAALSGPLPAIFPTALPDLKELGVQNTGVTIPQTPAFTAWAARITSGTQTSDGVITLDAANTRPSGLWADSTTLYVVGEDGGKVYAYTLAGGVRDTTKDIDLHTDNARPTGLWSDGTTLWVLDYDDRKIYAYTLADRMRAAAKDIESVPAGYGLWGRKDTPCAGSDATCLLWLVEAVDRSVQTAINLRAYRIYADADATPAVTYGSANASFNKSLPTGDMALRQLLEERGLWWKVPEPDGSPADDVATVWFSDFSGARLYAYSANPRVAESAADIVSAATQDRILAPANLSPTALWSDGTTWWVADLYAGKVFVYGPSAPITTPPITTPPTGTGPSSGTTGGGTGGGGGSPSQDEHGNTPAQATLIALDPTRTASTAGQLNTVADVDYFSVDVPHAGVLVVETSGPTATMGTVWQDGEDGEELATADSGGVGQNFRLSVRVAPGPVVIAVAGNGQQTGAYTLQVTFLPGYLENPEVESFQSGIGVISGWVCEAEEVEITLNGEPQEAAYGTARLDTEAVCGDSDNGFGLLFNWNLLGDGEHEVVALVDGVELDRATVTVTTLGAEFLRDVTGTCTAADFPTGDETVTLAWQQTQQNFVIVDGPALAGTTNRAGRAGVGYLENPGPNSFQSGIGVISGWVCEGAEVVIELNGEPQPAAYGTERLDTESMCGDTDNGFGLLFNWNLLGEGEHEVVAFVDGEELGRATVWVTTLGAEFLRDVEGECTVEDFPMLGETVTLAWQQNSQNFVITDVE